MSLETITTITRVGNDFNKGRLIEIQSGYDHPHLINQKDNPVLVFVLLFFCLFVVFFCFFFFFFI